MIGSGVRSPVPPPDVRVVIASVRQFSHYIEVNRRSTTTLALRHANGVFAADAERASHRAMLHCFVAYCFRSLS